MNLLIKTAFVAVAATTFTVFAVDSTESAPVADADAAVKTEVVDSSKSVEKVFTLEELATFNGKDGKSSYVAVGGVVYDLTNSKAWKNGVHHGVKAGTDASKKIQSAPHGTKVIAKLPVVGKLAQK